MKKTNSQFAQTGWDQSNVIAAPDGDPLQQLTAELEATVTEISAMRPKLIQDISASDFNLALELSKKLTAASSRLGAYASLWFSEDTQNQAAQAYQKKY